MSKIEVVSLIGCFSLTSDIHVSIIYTYHHKYLKFEISGYSFKFGNFCFQSVIRLFIFFNIKYEPSITLIEDAICPLYVLKH